MHLEIYTKVINYIELITIYLLTISIKDKVFEGDCFYDLFYEGVNIDMFINVYFVRFASQLANNASDLLVN